MIVVITLIYEMRCGVIGASVGEMATFKWPADVHIKGNVGNKNRRRKNSNGNIPIKYAKLKTTT